MDQQEIEELHEHCLICINMRCNIRSYAGHSCQMVLCPAGCGAKYHRCKQLDHENLCANEVVLCLNQWNGCKKRMARKKLKDHFPSCPAKNQGYSDGVQFIGLFVSRGRRGNSAADSPPTPINHSDSHQETWHYENNEIDLQSALWVVPWQQVQISLDYEYENPPFVAESAMSSSASSQEDDLAYSHQTSDEEEKKFSMDLLPFIVQRRIVEYLDAPSLRNLSLVSHKMRSLCAHMLRELGVVSLLWEKQEGKWVDSKRIWKF
ncbi:uncharacterized protein [Apostichopus japonicus]|uniref:uncharacterized protein n=1 Tax=Stichopus japonicus TaxID=307972 RepID=UPI003AB85A29